MNSATPMDFFNFYQKPIIEAQEEIRKFQEDTKLEMKRLKGWVDTKEQIIKDALEKHGDLTTQELIIKTKLNKPECWRALTRLRTKRIVFYNKENKQNSLKRTPSKQ